MCRTVPVILALGAWAAVCSGCQKVPSASTPHPDTARPKLTEADIPPAERRDLSGTREAWDIYLMHGKRIGYGHTTVRDVVENGQKALCIESLNHLAVKREGQMTEEDIRGVSFETREGRLLRLENEMNMGHTPIRTVGKVDGNQLLLEIGGTSETLQRAAIPWNEECFGPFATEQNLLRKPMRPGERRSFRMFMTGLNQVADVTMVAEGYELTPLQKGNGKLLRIETTTKLADGQRILGTVWADQNGETQKTSSQAMGLETFRVTKAEALGTNNVAEVDLIATSMVPLAKKLENAPHTKRARYRVRLREGNPKDVFAVGPNQTVRSIDEHTAEITVFAVRPGNPPKDSNAPQDRTDAGDIQPNRYIQSDDPVIVADAKRAAEGKTDPWQVAIALEQFVHREVKKKDYSRAFATASEVAKSLEGDCTEHAVFLAALARAMGIPARVAIGLVYMEPRQAFGYHMWNEVYVGDRWIPLDGTLALGGIGGDHLKIGQTNLQGISVYSTFLPVMQALGQLNIDLIEAE